MAILDTIKGYVYSLVSTKYTDPVQFAVFFESGLKMSNAEAKDMAWFFLAAADLLDNAPGLGVTKAAAASSGGISGSGAREVLAKPKADTFKASLKALGVGVPRKGLLEESLDLRIASFLQQYSTPNSAAKALSPAKRDALKAETRNLMRPDIWESVQFRSEYSSSLRG